MRFSTVALSAIASASLASAAPVPADEQPVPSGGQLVQDFIFPDEAVNGQVDISAEEEPVVVEVDGKKRILLVNATLAEESVKAAGIKIEDLEKSLNSTETEISKRDAWSWTRYRLFEPISKRDAEADADASADADAWSWTRYRMFEPISKRDAEADAEASADAWSWTRYRMFEPISKRDAEADAEASADAWSWTRYRMFEPISKRDAEADAEAWSWTRYRMFEPIS